MNPTIAVIHQNPAVVARIATMLRDHGYTVETACTESDALAIIRDDRPLVVVCDSEIDVFTAARGANRGHTKLIALVEDGRRVSYNRAVFRSFLDDPAPLSEIASACSDALQTS